jgi:hypothetical protein
MEHVARVCSYLLEYGGPLVADLSDEHRALLPALATKPAGWILGHLVVSGDFLRRQWHRPALTPREWGPRFGPGSRPSPDSRDYPSMVHLRGALVEVYRDLAAGAPAVPDDLLDAPNPFESGRGPFPSLRDFAIYLMTAHFGYHLGQLEGWRVAAGLPPRAAFP